MSRQYFKLKNRYIIDIDSNDITNYDVTETYEDPNNAANVTDFRNNYRIKLNLPVEFSRNAKLAIDKFDCKIPLTENNNVFYVEKIKVFTPSIYVKNQYLSNNKAHLKIYSEYVTYEYQHVTLIDSNDAIVRETYQEFISKYKNNDLELNSFELRSSEFTKNDLIINFQNQYVVDGNTLDNHGLINGSEFNLRLIIYDYDEDAVNYTPPEASIKNNILPMSNTGINMVL